MIFEVYLMNLKKKLCILFLFVSSVLNCFSVNSTVINFSMNPCDLLNESDKMIRSTDEYLRCFFQNPQVLKENPIDLKKLEIILVNKFAQQFILSEYFLTYMENKLDLITFWGMSKKYDKNYVETASVLRKMIIADLSEKKYKNYIISEKIWGCCLEFYRNKYIFHNMSDYSETMRFLEMCKFCRGRQFKAQGHVRAAGGFFKEACSLFSMAAEHFMKVRAHEFANICSELYNLSHGNFEKKLSHAQTAILPVTDICSRLNAKYPLDVPELPSTDTSASVSESKTSESIPASDVDVKEMIYKMFRFMPS